jgi:hypothetical protein
MAIFSSIAAATIASSAIAGGAALYGASQQSKAAKKAASAQQSATNQTLQLQRDQYNQTRADQEPWRQAGVGALNALANPNANFQASPDYQFRMNAGLEGVTQNRAVSGLLNSGSALRGLNDYAQNTASNEFGNWWNRQSGLAGVGQTANQSNQQAGSAYANNSGNALMANAQAQGQSAYYGANAAAQGAGQLAGAIGWGIQNYPYGGAGGASNPGAHSGGNSGGYSIPNIWRG